MNKTSIEWTTFSANPIKYRRKSDGKTVWACVKTSPGCANCYAEAIALRFDRGKLFNSSNMEEVEPFLDEDECRKMLTAKTIGGVPVSGARCFIGDMTDVFGEWIPDDLLDRLFAVFSLRPDVTFQVLTKRAVRLNRYFSIKPFDRELAVLAALKEFIGRDAPYANQISPDFGEREAFLALPNVWLGVSIENRNCLPRLPLLRDTIAYTRFISFEPLLEDLGDVDFNWINWVIVGCESRGAQAGRFADGYEAAARSITQQCQAAGVAVFGKQFPINGRVSHDPREWPEDLRVREFPKAA